MTKLGSTFSDNIIRSTKRRILGAQPQLTGWGARLTLYYLLLIAAFAFLLTRLFHLTVVNGYQYRQLSEGNRIHTAIMHAPRGIFFDRRHLALVKNIPAFRISRVCDPEKKCPQILVNEDEWKKLTQSDEKFFWERDYIRQYSQPYVTAHDLGYLNEITSDELANSYFLYQGFVNGDRMGRMGLEKQFEKTLRGIDGKELIEVNSQGRTIRTLGKVDSQPGKDLVLALDLDLQKTAYEAMGENPGAVIVSKPKSGEILALVSTPAFDPNKIHTGISQADFQDLISDSGRPLFNKAVSGVYPPGSLFKLVVALAGLESAKISRQTVFEDTGKLTIGEFSFSNWYYTQYGKTDGMVDIVKGIARSNDVFFYKLGEKVGVERIAEWGKKVGVGKKTGIELPGEAEGVMPDPEWRKKIRNEDWFLGDTYHLAIGQGDLAVTPLQVNLWTNVIASEGILCQPTLVSQMPLEGVKKWLVKESKDQNCRDLKIKKETIQIITNGMQRACFSGPEVEYQGTGWPLFNFSITRENTSNNHGQAEKVRVPIACKTGTAEVGDQDKHTHAWFTAFAPLPKDLAKNSSLSAILGDPEISVTVLVEKGGEGSTVAAPIAKKIFEEWFKR